MLITDVRARKKSMVAIYIDGEFAVNIDKETFLLSGYKVGIQISDEEFYDLIKNSDDRRAKEKALYLIEYRDHSSKELFDKIKRSTSEESALVAVEKMKKLGLVNDINFAKKLAKDLFYRKKFASKRVEYELIHKGIDREIAQEIIEEISPEPKEQLLELLLGKYKNLLKNEKGLKRTISSFQRLGYRWDDIRAVLEEIKECSSCDLEF